MLWENWAPELPLPSPRGFCQAAGTGTPVSRRLRSNSPKTQDALKGSISLGARRGARFCFFLFFEFFLCCFFKTFVCFGSPAMAHLAPS